MKTVNVAAAVICDDLLHPTTVFACERGYGPHKGEWEFPGGKLEPGETAEEALKREIREELDIEIEVGAPAGLIEYDYPEFHLHMNCYWAALRGRQPVLKEASSARWLTADTMLEVRWLPADLTLVEQLRQVLRGNG